MIIVDYQQVVISNMFQQLKMSGSGDVDEYFVRHMILNSLRNINTMFKGEYGQMVIACDNSSWRKDVFPYYKANRKKSRDESSIDWDSTFVILNKILEEIASFLPYKTIHLEKTEADDIIAVLTAKFSETEKIMIVSGDGDFAQLHKYPNVFQYDPIRKKKIKESNPEEYLIEHIIRGDKGDGIPNCLSNDNSIVVGERQITITSKRYEQMSLLYKMNGEMPKGFYRNKMLIDFENIPLNIKEAIVEKYNEVQPNSRNLIIPYFMKFNLKTLLQKVNEF